MWGMLGRRSHFSIVIKTSLQMGLPRKLSETICTIVHFLDVAGSQFVRQMHGGKCHFNLQWFYKHNDSEQCMVQRLPAPP